MTDPHSRLFLSCDLTGSTAFKQKAEQDPGTPWQKVFLQFYREFPAAVRSCQSARPAAQGLRFELWKAIGDELLFTCRVESELDIHAAVQTWIAAMGEYRNNSLSDGGVGLKDTSGLGVKGGAFIATFPGPDSEASIPRSGQTEKSGEDVVGLNRAALEGRRDHEQYQFDYFGPSIDTGFRLLSRSSSRYFVVSVEVAFALTCLQQQPGPHQQDYRDLGLVLRSTDALKGVWNGNDYPVMAIDLDRHLAVNKALAAFDSSRADVAKLHRLCEACYTSPGWPFRSYLSGSRNNYFDKRPLDPLDNYVVETLDGLERQPDEPTDAESIEVARALEQLDANGATQLPESPMDE